MSSVKAAALGGRLYCLESMMRRSAFAIGAALIVLTVGADAMAKSPVRPPVLSDNAVGAKLNWRIKPGRQTVDTLATDYNVRVGAGTVECVLDKNGRPRTCVAVGDAKADFVKFASAIAGYYKAASKDSLGQAIAGRKVLFTVDYNGPLDL